SGAAQLGVVSPNLLTANQASVVTDTTGLTAGTNTTIARVTTPVLLGSGSLSLAATASGTISASTANFSGAPSTYFAYLGPNAAGQVFTGIAFVRAASSARTCNAILRFYDASGNSTGSAYTGTSITDSTTGWTLLFASGTAYANTTQASLIVQVTGCGAGEIHYADCLQIAQGDYTDWFYPGTGYLNFDGKTLSLIATDGVPVMQANQMTVNNALYFNGTGSPNSAIAAPVGSIYTDSAGGAGTTLYVKESGTGNTGWVSK
ncbi:hypothetical protein ACYOEI_10160, partial [Singulisphaera rosea]